MKQLYSNIDVKKNFKKRHYDQESAETTDSKSNLQCLPILEFSGSKYVLYIWYFKEFFKALKMWLLSKNYKN